MDNGLSFELSEIEAAIKGYGNAVCPPVARFIGERIIEFDQERNEIGDSNETNNWKRIAVRPASDYVNRFVRGRIARYLGLGGEVSGTK